MSDKPLKDSGVRASFSTGSVRDSEAGKVQPGLISPWFLHRVGVICSKGAEKYEMDNWAKGQSMYRLFRSLMRHLLLWQLGQTDEDHLAQAGWNMMALIHHDEARNRGLLPPDLDDMAKYTDTRFGRFPTKPIGQPEPSREKPPCTYCRKNDLVIASTTPGYLYYCDRAGCKFSFGDSKP